MSKKLSKTQEAAPVTISLHAMKERRQVLELFRARRTRSQALSYTNAWVWLDREIARYDALIDAAERGAVSSEPMPPLSDYTKTYVQIREEDGKHIAFITPEPVQSDTVPFLSSPDGDDLTWEELTAPTQLDLGEIQRERETRIINGLRVPAQFVADAPRKSVDLYEKCDLCDGRGSSRRAIGLDHCVQCGGEGYARVGLTTGQFDHYVKMREQAEERLQVVRDELAAANKRIVELENEVISLREKLATYRTATEGVGSVLFRLGDNPISEPLVDLLEIFHYMQANTAK